MAKTKREKGIVGMRLCECRHRDGMVQYYLAHSYYAKDTDPLRVFKGKLAHRLGIADRPVDETTFKQLVENRNPITGGKLTPRDGKAVHAYDLNFHAPKGVSVMSKIGQDPRIAQAMLEASNETMEHAQERALCRVRKDEANYSTRTGELVWAEFPDSHSRPVGGVPDPHEHVHNVIFNATYDAHEGTYKSLKITGLKNDAPLLQAVFLSRLAEKVQILGYEIESQGNAWDIRGIAEDTKKKFSRRSEVIEEYLDDKGIVDERGKGQAGVNTREKKTDLSEGEIHEKWTDRLSEEERNRILEIKEQAIANGSVKKAPSLFTSTQALDYSVEKNFERNSVVAKSNVLADALLYKPGEVELRDLEIAIGSDQYQFDIDRNGRHWMTTQNVLNEEQFCRDFVIDHRGQLTRLGHSDYRIQNNILSEEQCQAIHDLLGSRDSATALLGPAGSGKTTLIKEVERGLKQAGRQVHFFAPTGKATDILKEDRFRANTIQSLLVSEKEQEKVANSVLWVDEAGLLSFRQMKQILDLAKTKNCRVILSGDSAQHTAVERGDSLRVLIEHAGLNGASISQIRRQKKEPLRDAIMSLASPERDFEAVLEGFLKLKKEKCIRELEDEVRYKAIANDYRDSLEKKMSCLVVSPTHAEGNLATNAIRSQLKEANILKGKSRRFETLNDLSLETAEKRRTSTYGMDMVVKFHQHAPNNLKAGISYPVVATTDDTVTVQKPNGLTAFLPLDLAERFSVYEREEIGICKGDRIQLTAKYQPKSGRSHSNKSIFKVKGFTKSGDILLDDESTLSKDFPHLKFGYVTTSHSSQGATVDRVIVAQSSMSQGAASSEQFYVSCSRAREDIHVYTDDSDLLLDQVLESCHRPSAMELVARELKDRSELYDFKKELELQQSYQAIQTNIPEPEAKAKEEKYPAKPAKEIEAANPSKATRTIPQEFDR